MKRLSSLVCVLLFLSFCLGVSAEEPPVVRVKGPTVIAFCPPVSDKEMEQDEGLNEVLADFQEYAHRVREPLQDAGVEFHELYARTVRIQTGKTVHTFKPEKADLGYYFIAPGRKPRIEYGVMTDLDIMLVAKEYFGLSR